MKNYYKIINQVALEDGRVKFEVALNPDCVVYQGHFPGNPISPGVCNIEMIRECIEYVVNEKLTIYEIKSCRFKSIISPTTNNVLYIMVKATPNGYINGYMFEGEIIDENNTSCLTIKGTMGEII